MGAFLHAVMVGGGVVEDLPAGSSKLFVVPFIAMSWRDVTWN